MSFIYRDALLPMLLRFQKASAVYHRFDKVWPKTDDGLYYRNRLYFYYGGRVRYDDPFNRFISILGIKKEDLDSNDYDEIEAVWFELKPKAYEYIAPNATVIKDAINEEFVQDDEFEVTITYGGDSGVYVSNHLLTWSYNEFGIYDVSINTDEIRNTLLANPWFYFANAVFGEVQQEDTKLSTTHKGFGLYTNRPVCQVSSTHSKYGVFAPVDVGSSVFEAVGKIYDETITTFSHSLGKASIKYTFKQKYKFTSCETKDKLVQDLVELADHLHTVKNPAYKLDTTIKRTLNELNLGTSSLFVGGKLDYNKAKSMKRKDFLEFLAQSIDTGYEVEEASFFEKAMGFIIIIAAIAVTILTAGSGSAAIGAAYSTSAWAAGLAAGAAVAALGAMILANIGGLSAMKQVKMVGQFAEALGIAAMIVGIAAFIQNGLQKLAAQKAAAEGTLYEGGASWGAESAASGAVELGSRNILEVAFDAVKNSISDFTSGVSEFTLESFEKIFKLLDGAFKIYAQFTESNPEQEEVPETVDQKTQQAETILYMSDKALSYDALEIFNDTCIRPYTDTAAITCEQMQV